MHRTKKAPVVKNHLVKIHNTTDAATAIKAMDGDQTVLPAQKIVTVNQKFLWALPKGIVQVHAQPYHGVKHDSKSHNAAMNAKHQK